MVVVNEVVSDVLPATASDGVCVVLFVRPVWSARAWRPVLG